MTRPLALAAALAWDRTAPAGRWLAGVGVLLLGLGAWWVFFGGGGMPLDHHDWPKEYYYYKVIQSGVESGTIPWRTHLPVGVTDKLLANPEVTLAPQLIALRWMEPAGFLMINTMLLFAAGWAGAMALAVRHQLGGVATAFLGLVVFFNGHMVAHLAVGHSMWAACFLLPWFVLGADWTRHDPAGRYRGPMLLAATMAMMLFHGGIHALNWCLLFLLAWLVAEPRRWRPIVGAVVGAGLLAAMRFLPAAWSYRGHVPGFLTGYPDLMVLVWALVEARPHTAPAIGGWNSDIGAELDWWEYSLYVGVPGLALLCLYGLWQMRGWLRGWAVPLAVVAICSLGSVYAPVLWARVPMLSGERVTSRLILLPFLFVVVAAARGIAEAGATSRLAVRWAIAVGVGLMALELLRHLLLWMPWRLRDDRPPWRPNPLPPLPPLDDRIHALLLGGGAVISLLAWGTLLWLAWREWRRHRGGAGS
jgi:hypothetical protein